MRSFKLLSVFSKFYVLFAILYLCASKAAVNVDRTRVIFSDGQNTQELNLFNDSTLPAIVQIWTDEGEIDQLPEKIKTPVISIPPILKMQPKEMRSVKLILNDLKNKDSKIERMLWLNIFQVYPEATVDGKNKKLKLPLRFRMKVFLRAKSIKDPTFDDYKKIRYEISANRLYIVNPTVWNISLSVGFSDGSKANDIICKPLSKSLIGDFFGKENIIPVIFFVVNDAGNTMSITANKL